MARVDDYLGNSAYHHPRNPGFIAINKKKRLQIRLPIYPNLVFWNVLRNGISLRTEKTDRKKN